MSSPGGRRTEAGSLAEIEQVLAAITRGSADAVVVETERGPELVELGSSQLTRFMLQRMPVGAATLDGDGRLLYVNPELARLAGDRSEEMVGRAFDEFVHPDDRPELAALVEPSSDESRLTLRVGSGESWAVARADFRPLDHRLPGVGALIVADVTAQSLAESRSRLRGELLDVIDAAVIATDLEGRIREWNRAATELYGWSRGEALGEPVERVGVGPADADLAERIIREVWETGRWSGRYDARCKDGSSFPAFVSEALTHDERGEPSGVVGVSVDISDQLEVEREAIRARNYLDAVTSQLAEGLYVADQNNELTYMNDAASELLGYSFEELAGRNMHEVVHRCRPDGSHYPAEECPITAIRRGEADSVVEDDDVFVRKDGTLLPVSFSASGFETADGARGVTVVFRDISREKAERERLTRELEQMSWVGPLRTALESGGLLLYSQPIERIATREVVQQELLVRMVGPGEEIITAGRFMPAAEQYNMVKEVDRWVIPEALRVAAITRKPIEFNLSAASIEDPGTAQLIESELAATGADPAHIVIEVTESGLISQQAVAERFSHQVRELGCRLALDDFGTGYGGFTYLTQLPVSILKIDQSFVRDLTTNPASRTVVRAVVGIAEEFGQTTVAEGVEELEALEMLGELGVDQAQGYFLGRPGPLPEGVGRTPDAGAETPAESEGAR